MEGPTTSRQAAAISGSATARLTRKAPVAAKSGPTVLSMKSGTSAKSAPLQVRIVAADGRHDDADRVQDLIEMLLKLHQDGLQ